MTNYTINTNHQFNSLEITFNDKPSEKIKEWYNTRKNNKSINNEIYLKDHA